MPPNPPSKGHGFTIVWLCAAYFDRGSRFFFMQIYISEKKILTPYQILYTLLAYMYTLIKDIKYKFYNSHTILMLYMC